MVLHRALREWPLLTNGVTVGVVTAAGDLLAQHIEHSRHRVEPAPALQGGADSHDRDSNMSADSRLVEGRNDAASEAKPHHYPDYIRTGVMSTWGATVFGPMWTAWYALLDRRMPLRNTRNTLLKVGITAVVMAPISNALFFAFVPTIERAVRGPWSTQAALEDVERRLRVQLLPTTIASAQVWVPANTVNWLVVPNHLRTVFSSLVGVGWNTYLSLTSHKRLSKTSS